MSGGLDFVVSPIRDLDGYYLQSAAWARELSEDRIDRGVMCQAFDENDFEVGKLAIDGDGKILIVEVEPSHRRRGIATRLLAEVQAAGYTVEHDWENMRDDGAAWARSVGSTPPDLTARARTVQ